MNNLVKEALWMPIREYRSVLFVFWPIILFQIMLHAFQIIQYSFRFNISVFSNVVIALVFLFVLLLTVSGIVNWHRKLVLGIRVEELRYIPKTRELQYLLYFIAVSLCIGVLGGLVSMVVILPLVGLQSDAFTPGQFPPLGTIITFYGSMLVVYLVVMMFCARLFMVLPRVAVEDDPVAWPESVSKKFRFGAEKSTALVLVHFLSMLPSLLISILSFSLAFSTIEQGGTIKPVFSPVPWFIFNIISIFTSIYAALAFASAMSLIYREDVRPVVQVRQTV